MNMISQLKQRDRRFLLINLLILVIGGIVLVFLPAVIFRYHFDPLIYSFEEMQSNRSEYTFGIVFGAGTKENGEPNLILKDRLDTAIDLYMNGSIDKILLSGANNEDNDEIDVMSRYIINNSTIKETDLLLDGHGLRTFDTCRRAVEVYGIYEAVLITSDYHLPRSLYLCEDSGMEGVGVGSTRHMYFSGTFFVLREVLATQKALIDTIILEPAYAVDEY